jgi:hypothetical protein
VANRYLTVKQVRQIIPVSDAKLKRDRAEGKGAPFIRCGRRVFYPEVELYAYLNSQPKGGEQVREA